MAATKAPKGETVNDLLGDIEDAEPIERKSGPRERKPIEYDANVLERIKASFTRTGAFGIKRSFPTEKDAAKSTNLLLAHAMQVVENDFSDKSCARRITQNEDNTYHVRIQLTHKRNRKPKDGEGEATPEQPTAE